MRFFQQLTIVLWKNWLLQKGRLFITVIEIFIPVAFISILVYVRSITTSKNIQDVTIFKHHNIKGLAMELYGANSDMILAYAPVCPATKKLIDVVERVHNQTMEANLKDVPTNDNMTIGYNKLSFKGFASADKAMDARREDPFSLDFIVDIPGVSKTSTDLPATTRFNFRPPYEEQWNTDLAFPLAQGNRPRSRHSDYQDSSVSYIQALFTEALIRYRVEQEGKDPDTVNIGIQVQKMAFPPFSINPMQQIQQHFFPFFLIMSFMICVVMNTKTLVYEKERRIKESMKLMGLSPLVYWLSWFLTFMMYLVPAIILYTVLLFTTVVKQGPIIAHTDGLLFFLFLLCYSLALITFCFMISTFVHKANVAAALSGLLFFVLYCGIFYINSTYSLYSRHAKLSFCLSFNIALCLGAKYVAFYEARGVGARFDNFRTYAAMGDNMSLFDCMLMLLVDATIHLLITWYLENIYPGEFGIPLPWYFPLMKSYWCVNEQGEDEEDYDPDVSHGRFEAEPTHLHAGIKIHKLKKVFGKKVVVAGTSLNMYENQITVLLGHNGAGKTTTMSMLTGFIPVTSGTAIINGHDLRTNIQGVRSSLGLCPQHDILFDTLTVHQHLKFFSLLKGASQANINNEIETLVTELGIFNKLHCISRGLSGGQKRKLSVAIALIGGSKVVILDEPSSGMDPAARRQTWTVLAKHREGRTMLLTTHYMDEADVLGDRIAIMAEGVVKCCGSSMFLKKLYGAGYHLIVEKTPKCSVDKLTKAVKTYVPASTLEDNTNTEATFLLPETSSGRFSSLFTHLDEKSAKLGIYSFGTNATTMEEVFLKVGESQSTDDDHVDPHSIKIIRHSSIFMRNSVLNFTNNDFFEEEKDLPEDGHHLVALKGPNFIVDDFTETVKLFVPGSSLTNVFSRTVIYNLPDAERDFFGPLFSYLENNLFNLGITKFGIPALTRVGETQFSAEPARQAADNIRESSESSVDTADHLSSSRAHRLKQKKDFLGFNKGFTKKKGLALEFGRIRGQLVKKALLTWRKKGLLAAQIIFPILGVLAILGSQDKNAGNIFLYGMTVPLVKFDLVPFGWTYIPYTAGRKHTNDTLRVTALYAAQFKGQNHILEPFDVRKYAQSEDYFLKRAKELGNTIYNRRMIIGFEAMEPEGDEIISGRAYFSGQPFHAEPISIEMMMNAFLHFFTNTSYKVECNLQPMSSMKEPFNYLENHEDPADMAERSMTFGVFIMFLMTFLTSIFIYYPIKERHVGSKHIQKISGITPLTYWGPMFIWDFIVFLIPNSIFLLVFILYPKEAFVEEGRWLLILVVLLLYGWSALPFQYALSFAFSEPPTGAVTSILLNLITGVTSLVTVTVFELLGPETEDKAELFDNIFTAVFPNYNMAQCFVKIDFIYRSNKRCKVEELKCHEDPWSPCCEPYCNSRPPCLKYKENYAALDQDGVGVHMLFMVINGVFYFIIVLLLNYDFIGKIRDLLSSGIDLTREANADETEDNDVAAERQRVNAARPSVLSKSDPLLLVNLYKCYGTAIAVNRVCIGVPEQECFGLLGQNGAGKTTTFKMMTGDVTVTEGNAYVNGYSVRSNLKEVQANMGYCPQFDAVLDEMTGRETLYMYSRLRGVPEENINESVENVMDGLTMLQHADKLVGTYSGGNKRKLSTAMALIGDPSFIMLDEPSAGMDPISRRQLWKVLAQVRESGRTLVLTSHSMEEVDALCTRICIMVNGKFRCLGSPQHLKTKFGQGYTLEVQMGLIDDGKTAPNEPFIDYVTEHFPGATVLCSHEGFVHFQVPDEEVNLATLFANMEETKKDLNVSHYSIQQTSLEQVFLTFTKEQNVLQAESKSGFMASYCHVCRGK